MWSSVTVCFPLDGIHEVGQEIQPTKLIHSYPVFQKRPCSLFSRKYSRYSAEEPLTNLNVMVHSDYSQRSQL